MTLLLNFNTQLNSTKKYPAKASKKSMFKMSLLKINSNWKKPASDYKTSTKNSTLTLKTHRSKSQSLTHKLSHLANKTSVSKVSLPNLKSITSIYFSKSKNPKTWLKHTPIFVKNLTKSSIKLNSHKRKVSMLWNPIQKEATLSFAVMFSLSKTLKLHLTYHLFLESLLLDNSRQSKRLSPFFPSYSTSMKRPIKSWIRTCLMKMKLTCWNLTRILS